MAGRDARLSTNTIIFFLPPSSDVAEEIIIIPENLTLSTGTANLHAGAHALEAAICGVDAAAHDFEFATLHLAA